MPTVMRLGPYRFFFFSSDGGEPTHVHVERDAPKAKFWLEPVALQGSVLFSRSELRALSRLINERKPLLLQSWHEYFDA